MKEWLDDYMEAILFGERQADIVRATFFKFFDFISTVFGDGAFSRYRNGEPVGRLAPAYFEAVVGGLSDIFDRLKAIHKP